MPHSSPLLPRPLRLDHQRSPSWPPPPRQERAAPPQNVELWGIGEAGMTPRQCRLHRGQRGAHERRHVSHTRNRPSVTVQLALRLALFAWGAPSTVSTLLSFWSGCQSHLRRRFDMENSTEAQSIQHRVADVLLYRMAIDGMRQARQAHGDVSIEWPREAWQLRMFFVCQELAISVVMACPPSCT